MNKNPFEILKKDLPQKQGQDVSLESGGSLSEKIEALLSSSELFLFMKGVPHAPQCGFSANVVAILEHLKVPYKSFDILSDPEMRSGVKEYANWPTFPQLYYKKELLGGNDIVSEMYQKGELQKLLLTS